jgi:DNA mismatch repair ATPase MutS
MPVDSYYTRQIASFSKELETIQGRIFLVAIARLIAFAGACVCIYWYIQSTATSMSVASFTLIILFILLLKWNFRMNEKKALLQKLVYVNNNELDILNEKLNKFDDGQKYLSDESYLNDIDVFGTRSLFHVLNRTTTSHGTNELANLLRNPLLEKGTVESYQEAIATLSKQSGLRHLLIAHGLLHSEKEGNLHEVGAWLETDTRLHKTGWVRLIRFVLPFINILALLYYWSTDNYIPLALCIIISWSLIGVFAKYITSQHTLLGKKQAILEQYSAILKIFSGIDTGPSGLLRELQTTSKRAYASIQQLARLSGLLDQRLNLVVNIFLNSFLLYDIQCLFALEKWKLTNKHFFKEWINCVGNIETLNSLAGFAFNNSDFLKPRVLDQGPIIEAKGLAHPLIPAKERIANDIELGRKSKLALITGSNMSGKTTFLRTIGVNLLLARCGAPVCASAFSFSPMHLLTAIRISDSLQQHTSYFMAELKRLQGIIQYLETGKPALVLVDEILRGTNSDDKTHGSAEFIRKIIGFNCLTLFATHDLSLSKLEEVMPGVVVNYCFESTILNDELYFDYRLQPGIAKNKNASFLMRKMDII